ncbi:hypothetical protein P8H27_04525 [Pseudomonas sp. sp1636]|uniref:hypothetical protein n=1 Tax=Pseudomonas sp. sp1636 TaxID=3036707 RepID=UPI0025A56D51|nr:hypothetical protein [Pseudomonas sp. sp1636]MDM8348158.1 hypothetical protein [Pseudomonas sp. sp1636]
MIGRIPVLAVLVASLALAGEASARGSERNAVIAGAVVGAMVGGAIAAHRRYERTPLYVEIGAPPAHGYYRPYPRHYQPPALYYRPYPVEVRPYYQYRPRQQLRHHRFHYRKHQRYHRGYYAPRR